MKINLPNKLTIIRVLLVPVFIIFFLLSKNDINIIYFNNYNISVFRLFALIVFIIASITDYFDGVIARKYNLITNFGKLMDPLADKILVVSALMLLSDIKLFSVVFVIIVVIREISISAIRLVALEQGTVVAASKLGKYKTATQMIAVVLFLANVQTINLIFYFLVYFVFYLSEFFVIISFIDYIVKNKNAILSGGM